MLYTQNYRARLVEYEDLDFITDIRTSKEVQDALGSFIFTNKISQEEWLKNIANSETKKFLIFEEKKENKYNKIGLIRLSDIDFINSSMCIGGDLGREFRGLGHGSGMYELIFKLGFDVWGLNRLWLLVLSDNVKAINLYKKSGFVEEGRQRNSIYKNGEYKDYIMMSILKDEYSLLNKNK